jgi:hypothetical protein
MPTNTPTPTSTPVPPTATPTATSTPTPKFFAIQSRDFDDGVDCGEPSEYRISEGSSPDTFGIKVVRGSLRIAAGGFAIFCYEAKHTWIGTVAYAGYTINSDANDPLQFQVTRDRGYVYIGGKGSVTMPDRTIVELP